LHAEDKYGKPSCEIMHLCFPIFDLFNETKNKKYSELKGSKHYSNFICLWASCNILLNDVSLGHNEDKIELQEPKIYVLNLEKAVSLTCGKPHF
jgi:hypothetical protein